APLPADENHRRVDVGRGRAEASAIEGGSNLLGRATEVPERPDELDVLVPHLRDLVQGAVRVAPHRVTQRVKLEANALEPACARCEARDDARMRCEDRAGEARVEPLDEPAAVHDSRPL